MLASPLVIGRYKPILSGLMEKLRTLERPHCWNSHAVLSRGQMRDPHYFASNANMGKPLINVIPTLLYCINSGSGANRITRNTSNNQALHTAHRYHPPLGTRGRRLYLAARIPTVRHSSRLVVRTHIGSSLRRTSPRHSRPGQTRPDPTTKKRIRARPAKTSALSYGCKTTRIYLSRRSASCRCPALKNANDQCSAASK